MGKCFSAVYIKEGGWGRGEEGRAGSGGGGKREGGARF